MITPLEYLDDIYKNTKASKQNTIKHLKFKINIIKNTSIIIINITQHIVKKKFAKTQYWQCFLETLRH